jgi:DNA-directed RNA polymerase specialized sigma24 family protein
VTPLASCLAQRVSMTQRAQLHLVNAEGAAVDPAIHEAVETAYRWVLKDFPTIDQARLANWAEALAVSMEARGSGISSPKHFAYPALRGKVLDSFRKGSSQELSSGVGRDLERLGGRSGSFQGAVDQKILFEQIHEALSKRDRDILTLILSEKPTQQVAEELQTSAPAARKAIQRVKERIGAILNVDRKRKDVAKQSAINQRGLAIER